MNAMQKISAFDIIVASARAHLTQRLIAIFQTPPMVSALGAQRASDLALTLHGGGSLAQVAIGVRDAVIENQAGSRLTHWGLIHVLDAIGFYTQADAGCAASVSNASRGAWLHRAREALDAADQAMVNAPFLQAVYDAIARR